MSSKNSVHFRTTDRTSGAPIKVEVDLYTFPNGELINPKSPSIFVTLDPEDAESATVDLSSKQARKMGRALLRASRNAKAGRRP